MDSLKVRIGDTALGKAVFATAKFKAGVQVGVIEGKMITDPDYGSDYCIALDESLSIEPDAPFRFLNHSCEPNCELITWEYEDTPEMELVIQTLRPIASGEELTIDYGWPADAAIQCQCGAKTCRGWVVSKHEIHQLA